MLEGHQKISTGHVCFSYQNSSNESFIFQPSIQIKEQYSCIKFDGGKQDPYPETVFNTTNNNQIEPNPRQKTQIEQTEKNIDRQMKRQKDRWNVTQYS